MSGNLLRKIRACARSIYRRAADRACPKRLVHYCNLTGLGLLLFTAAVFADSDVLRSHVITLEHRSPEAIASVIKPLLPDSAALSTDHNRIILLTTKESLQQIQTLIHTLDQPVPSFELWVQYTHPPNTFDGTIKRYQAGSSAPEVFKVTASSGMPVRIGQREHITQWQFGPWGSFQQTEHTSRQQRLVAQVVGASEQQVDVRLFIDQQGSSGAHSLQTHLSIPLDQWVELSAGSSEDSESRKTYRLPVKNHSTAVYLKVMRLNQDISL